MWLLVICLGAALAAPTAYCSPDSAKKAVELKHLQNKIARLQGELQSNQKKKSRAERQLEDVEKRINDTRRALRKTDLEFEALRRRLNDLQTDRQITSATLRHQSAELSHEALTTYSMGRQQRIKMLLNQEQPSAVGRMLVYFSYVSRARQAKIDTMQATLQHFAAVNDEIHLKTEALTALQVEQRRQVAELDAQRRDRARKVVQLSAQLDRQGDELKRLQRDEKQLQALLRSLQELLADVPAEVGQEKPFKDLKGQLRWPAHGQLVKRFGSRRGSSGLTWQGVLIEPADGTQVQAVSRGRVAFADWLRGFGLLLIIDHGDGYMSLYGHNEALYKEVGEWVDSGEVVATSGTSTGSTEAGLYFEIRHNGQPVNPLIWCAGTPAAVSG